MGYESRITVVNREYTSDTKGFDHFDQTIATFDMAKVHGELLDVFTKKYDNGRRYTSSHTDLYMNGTEVETDNYGDVPKECDFKTFYSALLGCEAREGYRRYRMLISFLTPFINNTDWDEIVIVHTGY